MAKTVASEKTYLIDVSEEILIQMLENKETQFSL